MRKRIFIILFLLFSSTAYGQVPISEESVKSAFIYHFLGFTQWNDNQPNYYICIPDDEDLKATAEESFKGKMVNNRKIVVTGQSTDCHILVSDEAQPSNTVLTIGSLAHGAMFEFRVVDNKLRFAINLHRIKNSKLKISSQLLKLAILEGA